MCDYQQRLSIERNQEKCEETEGFDVQAGLNWIYPTNYPIRDYQYNIIEQALYKNTLVNLPTGLGKTFIAAVVMYNYYRWYPTGKIVFMAPTRPLVKQQIDACYNIMAIPKNVTAELTGTNKTTVRNDIWMDKRVFFVTPQVLQNDLDSCPELALLIKCIVFDEAHKARGNYAYCEVMKKIKAQAKNFRVLALSATPGNSINDVGEVINTLMISNLEYRTEESEDVKSYVFQRKLETIVVPLGQKLEQVRNSYLEVLEKYNRTLLKYKVVQGNCRYLTKGAIFRIRREYQEKSNRDPHYREVTLTLNICMSLYHASEVLIRHGLRGFLNYFEEHINDPLLKNNDALIKIMEDVRGYLGPLPAIEGLPDGSYPEVPSNIMFGHPKFFRLRDILISHFNDSDDRSKVIVFFEYRDSVKEAFLILLQARPIIRPEMFVGQKSGVVTQKMQLRVIKTFRDGDCNTLLSTSIGEEGLDVGEVDLIVCFDISNKSPIRMVQRMGRTGRKREGRVVILVTEGKEQQTLNDCLFHKNNMKSWAGSRELMKNFFVDSPRMVPRVIQPQCMKMQITVQKPTILKNTSVKNFMRKISSPSTSTVSDDVEIIEITEKIPDQISLFNKSLNDIKNFDLKPFCGDYIEHQRKSQHSSKICSSDASKLFVNLMKFADAKRFNIPLTQETRFPNKNLKQGDIRNMFMNIGTKNGILNSQGDFMTQAFSFPTQKELSSEEIKYREFHNKLHEEISIYLAIQQSTTKICKFCEKGFKCPKYKVKNDLKFIDDLDNWIPPDSNFFQDLTAEDLESYMKSKLQEDDAEDSISELIYPGDLSDLFPDEKIDEKVVKEKSFTFDAPQSFENLIDKYNISSTFPNQNQQTINSSDLKESEKQTNDQKTSGETCKDENLNSVLSFFKLDKIEDIFELDDIINNSDDSDKTIIDVNVAQDLNFERELSPVLNTQISQRNKIIKKNKPIEKERPSSPVLDSSILCHSQKEISSKGRLSLDIIDTSIEEKNVLTIPRKFSQKLSKGKTGPNNVEHNGNKHKRLLSTNSDEENLLGLFSTKKRTTKKSPNSLSLGDVFDLWAFGLTIHDIDDGVNKISQVQPIVKENMKNTPEYENEYDLHNFSIMVNAESTRVEEHNRNETNENEKMLQKIYSNMTHKNSNYQSKNEEINASVPEIDDFCDLSIFGLTQSDGELNSGQQNAEQLSHQTLQFNEFFDHMGTKNMSTQKKTNKDVQKYPEKIKFDKSHHSEHMSIQRKVTDISHGQKNNETRMPTQTEKNNDNESDVLIIEDSPIKEDFIDLTQSPKERKKLPQKRKILSQMSITQILSLAEKPTQSISSYIQSNSTAVDENRQYSSLKSKISSTNKPERTSVLPKIRQNTKEKELNSNLIIDLDSLDERDKSPRQYTKTGRESSLDDLREFDELKESICEKQPPLFKKPSITNQDKIRKERKNHLTTSAINLNTASESEDINSSRTSLKLSNSILDSNSDDEFETTIYPNTMSKKQKKSNDCSLTIPKKKVRKKTKTSDFIEEEAEVSIDRGSISDDESDEDESFDESFVDDENFENNTQMQANYLQSVRSPSTGPKFKMPRTLRPITDDIFSQPAVRDELNSYVVDSFCVNTEDINEESHELSELDILEEKLKKMRKKRKETGKAVKRRRIRMIGSDSD